MNRTKSIVYILFIIYTIVSVLSKVNVKDFVKKSISLNSTVVHYVRILLYDLRNELMRAYYKENKKLQTYNIIIENHFSNQSIRILLYSYTGDKVYIHKAHTPYIHIYVCVCVFFFFCHDRNPVVIVQLGIN